MAERTLLHQLVFDWTERKLVPLTPTDLDPACLTFAGEYVSDEVNLTKYYVA